MRALCGFIILMFSIGVTTNGFFDIIEVKNKILDGILNMTNRFDLNTIQNHFLSSIGVASNGIFDLGDVKNKLLQWKNQKLASVCPSNAKSLINLLNIVCSTAQPTNMTTRDACYNCFTRVTSMPEGPQELSALSVCATQYFVNTSYAACATSLMALSTSALSLQQSTVCFSGYCDFVRCLRRRNTNNLIIQCTREARTGVNITLDADNVRFYTNVTSCILAKARCGSYNPITGEVQTPGYSTAGAKISNALQFSDSGELRLLAFPTNTKVLSSFCASSMNLTQTNWLTNVC